MKEQERKKLEEEAAKKILEEARAAQAAAEQAKKDAEAIAAATAAAAVAEAEAKRILENVGARKSVDNLSVVLEELGVAVAEGGDDKTEEADGVKVEKCD